MLNAVRFLDIMSVGKVIKSKHIVLYVGVKTMLRFAKFSSQIRIHQDMDFSDSLILYIIENNI